jgi:hypothetical protein
MACTISGEAAGGWATVGVLILSIETAAYTY